MIHKGNKIIMKQRIDRLFIIIGALTAIGYVIRAILYIFGIIE